MSFRKDPVEYLLRREFPDYLLLKGLTAAGGLNRGSGSVGTEERDRRANRKRDIEQREGDLRTLQFTNPQEFQRVLDAELAKDWEESRQRAEREEQERFFNQPRARANFDYWAKMPLWSIDEGVALWLGKEPSVVRWDSIKPLTQVSAFAKQFADIREIANRATILNQIGSSNLPGHFVAWANRIGPKFPEELEAAVANRWAVADWQTAYERERAARIEAEARADRAHQPAPKQSNTPSGKPEKIRSDREQNLLRVIAGIWALSSLPPEHNVAADKISALFSTWKWDKPAAGTIADTVLAEAAKIPGAKIQK